MNPAKKVEKGAAIIKESTNNPLVPGNGPCLAAFVAAQANLIAATQALTVARDVVKQATLARNDAVLDWDTKVSCLAAFTEAVTDGNPTAIMSAGFGVRANASIPKPLTAPLDLLVKTNGSPGISKLSWSLAGADTFLVERSPDPVTATSWEQVRVTTKTQCEIPGAEPGEKCWFRVAGVNTVGQGPWSAEAPRPVM